MTIENYYFGNRFLSRLQNMINVMIYYALNIPNILIAVRQLERIHRI